MYTHQIYAFSKRCIVLAGCVVATPFLGGCGGDRGPERVVVSGTVTYNGKPVSEGMIRFVPDEKTPAPTAGAAVVDGKYIVDRRGGVPVGTFRVQIEAYRASASPRKANASDSPQAIVGTGRQQYLPKKYNVSTKLELIVQPGSTAITKNFDLTD